jgi:hypothetical protein
MKKTRDEETFPNVVLSWLSDSRQRLLRQAAGAERTINERFSGTSFWARQYQSIDRYLRLMVLPLRLRLNFSS